MKIGDLAFLSEPTTLELLDKLLEKQLSLVVKAENEQQSGGLLKLSSKKIPKFSKGAWNFDCKSSESECYRTEGWSLIILKCEEEKKNMEVPVPEENKLRYYIRDTEFLNELLRDIIAMQT